MKGAITFVCVSTVVAASRPPLENHKARSDCSGFIVFAYVIKIVCSAFEYVAGVIGKQHFLDKKII